MMASKQNKPSVGPHGRLESLIAERFGGGLPGSAKVERGLAFLELLVSHRVHRTYTDQAVDPELIELLCTCALSAPSKSDLQQRDIVIVDDPTIRTAIADRLPHMPWTRAAPAFLVFCINGRRLPTISDWKGKPFPNDHFDLLFNGVGDAAITLAWFLMAAESVGLAGCPISEIRNFASEVSDWLGLPGRVIPFAGFCLGWPAEEGQISPRLPLAMTVHKNRYCEEGLLERITAYDRRREQLQPYAEQKDVEQWGTVPEYGWSEQKARQYAIPQRTDFGAFVRARGFRLD
jgi:nitroreductase/FMN reductase [NAD(P)H]